MSPAKKAQAEAPVDQDLLIGDHEYDGIQEYDNPLPRWWKLIFWGSFFFAIGYLFHYHVTGNGTSVAEAYAADMKEAEEAEAKRAAAEVVTPESLQKLIDNPSAVTEGQGVFTARCVACHGDKGQGIVGPNLTDNSWIHGAGKPMDIYKVVSEGVAAKGMPAWSKQLTPKELRSVVAYVVKDLKGTNAAGKPPEGNPVE
ncbi:MAG: c-type cytochrome [Myxococcales bacterium]|nr:c-type cytochrome [Myxococcales bacterium]MCB9580635.1 c-type cytochrome [Polyangiaceae bacterium]